MLTQPANQPARAFFRDFFNRAKSAFSRWCEARQFDAQEIDVVARDLERVAISVRKKAPCAGDFAESAWRAR